MQRWIAFAGIVFLLSLVVSPATGAEPTPRELEGITVSEKLGQQLPVDVPFVDQNGRAVRLSDFFDGKRPVLLTLNYYRCPMLCNLQLNALTDGLKGLEWAPGDGYRVVTISIDHRETPDLAQGKRQSHVTMLGKGEVDWNFLVGDERNIRRVADAVGFGYRYDPDQDQWAHPAVAVFISPEGKLTRYLYGIDYPSRDLKFAVMEASEGRVGSTIDQLILSCFHYDSSKGKYGPFAFGIMRLAGMVTLLVLGVFLAIVWRKELRRSRERLRIEAGQHPKEAM